MMMTEKRYDPRAKAAVTAFEKAARAHEMKGAQHPDDWEGIERRYQNAKARLLEIMGL